MTKNDKQVQKKCARKKIFKKLRMVKEKCPSCTNCTSYPIKGPQPLAKQTDKI